MQNVALVDAQEVYKEHTMVDDKVVLKNVKCHFQQNIYFILTPPSLFKERNRIGDYIKRFLQLLLCLVKRITFQERLRFYLALVSIFFVTASAQDVVTVAVRRPRVLMIMPLLAVNSGLHTLVCLQY